MRNFKWYRKMLGGIWYCNVVFVFGQPVKRWSRFKRYTKEWDCMTIKKEKYIK